MSTRPTGLAPLEREIESDTWVVLYSTQDSMYWIYEPLICEVPILETGQRFLAQLHLLSGDIEKEKKSVKSQNSSNTSFVFLRVIIKHIISSIYIGYLIEKNSKWLKDRK